MTPNQRNAEVLKAAIESLPVVQDSGVATADAAQAHFLAVAVVEIHENWLAKQEPSEGWAVGVAVAGELRPPEPAVVERLPGFEEGTLTLAGNLPRKVKLVETTRANLGEDGYGPRQFLVQALDEQPPEPAAEESDKPRCGTCADMDDRVPKGDANAPPCPTWRPQSPPQPTPQPAQQPPSRPADATQGDETASDTSRDGLPVYNVEAPSEIPTAHFTAVSDLREWWYTCGCGQALGVRLPDGMRLIRTCEDCRRKACCKVCDDMHHENAPFGCWLWQAKPQEPAQDAVPDGMMGDGIKERCRGCGCRDIGVHLKGCSPESGRERCGCGSVLWGPGDEHSKGCHIAKIGRDTPESGTGGCGGWVLCKNSDTCLPCLRQIASVAKLGKAGALARVKVLEDAWRELRERFEANHITGEMSHGLACSLLAVMDSLVPKATEATDE